MDRRTTVEIASLLPHPQVFRELFDLLKRVKLVHLLKQVVLVFIMKIKVRLLFGLWLRKGSFEGRGGERKVG